jgi:hypothetical protein
MEVLPPAAQLKAVDIEPAFYRAFEHLIHYAGLSEASVPHDKLYEPAVMALRLFSTVKNPDFPSLNYKETVAEVYTGISGLILQHTQRLSLLAHVEEQSFRQQKYLPSWVPDFSVRMFNLWFGCQIIPLIAQLG